MHTNLLVVIGGHERRTSALEARLPHDFILPSIGGAAESDVGMGEAAASGVEAGALVGRSGLGLVGGHRLFLLQIDALRALPTFFCNCSSPLDMFLFVLLLCGKHGNMTGSNCPVDLPTDFLSGRLLR